MADPAINNGDPTSLPSVKTLKPPPLVITKLVKRVRALTLALLPVEVDPKSINEPTSRVITPQVIAAYAAAAGDFTDALPYCLIRARVEFMKDAYYNLADYGENYGRAVACEVLARRIVHQAEPERMCPIMSTRFKHLNADGEETDLVSALEMAIDSHCPIFLSSTEAQDVINALWGGDLIQKNNENNDIEYVHYHENHGRASWGHFDASRLSVPRYQNIFRIAVWLFFLVVYSQAVREPLERLSQRRMDAWERILYTMSLSFLIENLLKAYKLFCFATWRAFRFWDAIALTTDALLWTAFVLRVLGISREDPHSADKFRLWSFQVLSFVAPFIWMSCVVSVLQGNIKLLTIFDGFKYFGMMQICVARMLQESSIFFALLSVLALGFGQGLYALDVADGNADDGIGIVNVLLQGLLASPNYDKFSASTAGLILFYFWNVVTVVILLNVLISLFSSAYSDVVDDAEAEFLFFFASKTVAMIRAPDSYVYPAPFNLIEVFLVAPFELLPFFSLSPVTYAKLNRYVMTAIFFLPLSIIALHESNLDGKRNSWMRNWLKGRAEVEDWLADRDPELDGELQITKVPFEQLLKAFPDTQQSSEASIVRHIGELKSLLAAVNQRLDKLNV